MIRSWITLSMEVGGGCHSLLQRGLWWGCLCLPFAPVFRSAGPESDWPLCISARETKRGLTGTGGKKRKEWVVVRSTALPIKPRRAVKQKEPKSLPAKPSLLPWPVQAEHALVPGETEAELFSRPEREVRVSKAHSGPVLKCSMCSSQAIPRAGFPPCPGERNPEFRTLACEDWLPNPVSESTLSMWIWGPNLWDQGETHYDALTRDWNEIFIIIETSVHCICP